MPVNDDWHHGLMNRQYLCSYEPVNRSSFRYSPGELLLTSRGHAGDYFVALPELFAHRL